MLNNVPNAWRTLVMLKLKHSLQLRCPSQTRTSLFVRLQAARRWQLAGVALNKEGLKLVMAINFVSETFAYTIPRCAKRMLNNATNAVRTLVMLRLKHRKNALQRLSPTKTTLLVRLQAARRWQMAGVALFEERLKLVMAMLFVSETFA